MNLACLSLAMQSSDLSHLEYLTLDVLVSEHCSIGAHNKHTAVLSGYLQVLVNAAHSSL